MKYQGVDSASRGDGETDASDVPGMFLSDLAASAAVHVLARLDPVDRARVAACRRAERIAMTHRGHGTALGTSPTGPRFDSAEDASRGVSSRDPAAEGHSAEGHSAEGHLADAAWRDVDLRGVATSVALESLRNLARGSIVGLDASGSRGVTRGEFLEFVRECPRLRDLKVARVGDAGKFSCDDCRLFLAACPSLRRFECDVWVSAAKGKEPRDVTSSRRKAAGPEAAAADLGALLAPGGATVIKRLKIHSADARSAAALTALAAEAASETKPRVKSLDISWGLKLSCQALEGVAAACETKGRGFPFARLAMRKANVKCAGARRLALAIERAARAVERHENATRELMELKLKAEDGGRRDAVANAFSEDEFSDREDGTPKARNGTGDPTCRLRWLDLGSNLIGDGGGAAVANSLGPRVPITRLNLRDNPLGVEACAALGAAVARCPTLRRLDLAHCGFGDAGLAAFCAGVSRGAPGAAPETASCGLRVLQLGFNNIGAIGVKALVECYARGAFEHLEHLDLACNVLGPEGTAALAPLLEPRESSGFERFETVSASSADAEDDDAEDDDADVARRRVSVSSELPPARGPSGSRPRRSGLYSLDLAVNGCAAGAGAEAGAKAAERFGVKALLRALEKNTTLRRLNVRGNDLTPEIAGDVAEMLLENATLRMVNVGYNKISDEGIWEISEALTENEGLRGLDVQRNEISDDGADFLKRSLTVNTTIAEVDMRANMLSPEVVAAFGDVFGNRVNCRWQQEPPKALRDGGPEQARMVADGSLPGGGVVARRAAKKAAKAKAKKRDD
jgi:Ran GTPase-activating protein (RanGAP) involved in mRNA processing and transport